MPRPHHPRRARFALAIVASAVVWGCGSPTGPSPGQGRAEIAGLWKGTAADSSGQGEMTWQLAQSGSSVSGSLTLVDAPSAISGRGSVSGSISGSSLRFSMHVPVGGFDSPFESCSADASGDAQTTGSSITATYSGANSCTGTITSGELTLTRMN